MTKEEFKAFCHEEFTRRGFRKHRNGYYMNGPEGLLCGMFLQKSNYGPAYYVNCCFHLQTPDDLRLPPSHDMDMDLRRILVMTKSEHDQRGETFLSGLISYEEYSVDELKPYFDREFDEYILPVIRGGREYVKNNLDKFSLHVLYSDRVMQKLREEP